MKLRRATTKDLERIVDINNDSAKWVGGEATIEDMKEYLTISRSFIVAKGPQGKVQGFIITMDDTSDYDSVNFLWFKERYYHFCYVDRIVIDKEHRKQGYASALYHCACEGQPFDVVGEILVYPYWNEDSIIFHVRHGFEKVGVITHKNGNHCVMYRLDRNIIVGETKDGLNKLGLFKITE